MPDGPRAAPALALPVPRDLVLIVIGLLGISLSGPIIAATAAPALAIAFWRNALGAAVTGSVAGAGRIGEFRGLSGRQWRTAAVAGILLALHFATWVPSLAMTTVAASTALVCSQPIFVVAIARFQGNRFPRRVWLGIAVAVLGAALITGADVSLSVRAVTGDLLALAGALFAAGYVTVGARARATMSAPVYTTACYSCCALLLLAACAVGRQPLVGFSGNAWVKIVAVTIAAQLLGHTLFNIVLRSTGPTVVSIAILLETPGAALVALLWLHQHPPLTAWPGVVLLLAAIATVITARGEELPVEATE
jgi:drug/metabolite transporter (DMT)-like permease